jgi:pimeloyl-ACP methyl ester carboxylesterase
MKTEKALNEKILKLTENIRKNHPELVKYLNEMPETIPLENTLEINANALTVYHDSLVSLIKEYEGRLYENVQKATKIKAASNANSDLLVELNNISLSYSYAGEGNVPILFLHGFPFDKSMWKEQIESLKNSCCVIAIDIRGFGKSKDEKTHLSIDLFAEDLVSFMDKRNIDKAIICGLSMGGFIALNAVKRFPERFEALILCDTQCIADTPEVKEKRTKTIEQIERNGADTFKDEFVKSVFHPDSLKNKTKLVESLRSVVFGNSNRTISAGLTALAERSETCSSLKDINIPTLIICGRADEVTPLAQSEFMHEQIKDSTLKIIENAGHVSNLEQPTEFNLHLLEFLISLNFARYIEPNSEPLNPKVEIK